MMSEDVNHHQNMMRSSLSVAGNINSTSLYQVVCVQYFFEISQSDLDTQYLEGANKYASFLQGVSRVLIYYKMT